jgi:hypothetical protein
MVMATDFAIEIRKTFFLLLQGQVLSWFDVSCFAAYKHSLVLVLTNQNSIYYRPVSWRNLSILTYMLLPRCCCEASLF